METPDGSLVPRWAQDRRKDDDGTTVRISRTIIQQVMEAKHPIISIDADTSWPGLLRLFGTHLTLLREWGTFARLPIEVCHSRSRTCSDVVKFDPFRCRSAECP